MGRGGKNQIDVFWMLPWKHFPPRINLSDDLVFARSHRSENSKGLGDQEFGNKVSLRVGI